MTSVEQTQQNREPQGEDKDFPDCQAFRGIFSCLPALVEANLRLGNGDTEFQQSAYQLIFQLII